MAARPNSPAGVSDCSADDSVFPSDSRLSLAGQGKALQTSFLTEEDQPPPPPPPPAARAFLPAAATTQHYHHAFPLSRSEPALSGDAAAARAEEHAPPAPPPASGAAAAAAADEIDASSAALDAALRAARLRAFHDDSSSGLLLSPRAAEASSDSLADFGCGLRRKLSWKLVGRRNTEQRAAAASPAKSVRWATSTSLGRADADADAAPPPRAARFAGSRSMPDALGYDDVAERRARAQFARSRNNARIWGSSRSNGSLRSAGSVDGADGSSSAEFGEHHHRPARRGAPCMREALECVLPCALNDSYLTVVCAVTAALTALPDCRPHCEALLRAGAVYNASVQDAVEVWPPQRPAPRVTTRGRGVYLATAMPFGEAVAVVAAMLAMHGNLTVRRRAHRTGRGLVVAIALRAEGGGVAARAEIAERGDDTGCVDVGIVRSEGVLRKFSSKRRDAFASFRDDIAKVWASVGVATGETEGELSSSRLLKGAGASWRRRNTTLV